MLLGQVEKEMLRKHLWLVAERCGIEVLTYQVMTNHLHIMVRAPRREPLPDAELLRRYALLHPGISYWEQGTLERIERMLAAGGEPAEAWRAAEMRKMCDVSEYMKLLKQRFSIWYNRAHQRFGTLWAERFKSILVERGEALLWSMAYVDRNGIRAGLCRDPQDYRFGGYAEALAGNKQARKGIMTAVGSDDWEQAHARYRAQVLAGLAEEPRQRDLPMDAAASLGRKCRYFTDGAVLGTQAFVMTQVAEFRRKTGRGSRTMAHPVPIMGVALAIMRRLSFTAEAG